MRARTLNIFTIHSTEARSDGWEKETRNHNYLFEMMFSVHMSENLDSAHWLLHSDMQKLEEQKTLSLHIFDRNTIAADFNSVSACVESSGSNLVRRFRSSEMDAPKHYCSLSYKYSCGYCSKLAPRKRQQHVSIFMWSFDCVISSSCLARTHTDRLTSKQHERNFDLFTSLGGNVASTNTAFCEIAD